jgi:UDP-3-O-[3-hydroxymyristoyl] N-acetylglucosamine deacetylase
MKKKTAERVMEFQKTVGSEIRCHGIGLHTGRKVNMTIRPGEADSGVVFVRKDLSKDAVVEARLGNVCDTTLATTIGVNGTRISTVEHLLSAFRGAGVDNAVVEIDCCEVPIMDGSARPFVALLKSGGLKSQGSPRKWMVIERPVSVSDGEGEAAFLPSSSFKITYTIEFNHPLVKTQVYSMTFSPEGYEKAISPARTFGFLKDVEYLQAKGLALGGSLKTAVVLDETKVINKEGLRFPDEFVRHKILDAVGDLFLLGMPILGHFVAKKSGHKLNNMLLEKLLTCRDCWKVLDQRAAFPKEKGPLRVAGSSLQSAPPL